MYKFKSLNDIAVQFRANAKEASEAMNRSVDRNYRNMYSGKAISWNAAANILENTELTND